MVIFNNITMETIPLNIHELIYLYNRKMNRIASYRQEESINPGFKKKKKTKTTELLVF